MIIGTYKDLEENTIRHSLITGKKVDEPDTMVAYKVIRKATVDEWLEERKAEGADIRGEYKSPESRFYLVEILD